MSEPEKYFQISRDGVYYVHVHRGPNVTKCVGIGNKRFPSVTLEASEALSLLEWLKQNESELQRLAKEQE